MDFTTLLSAAKKAGVKSLQREESCRHQGGHHPDHIATANSRPAWRCRCGFLAVQTAKIWQESADIRADNLCGICGLPTVGHLDNGICPLCQREEENYEST